MKIISKYNLLVIVGCLLFAGLYSLTVWTAWLPQWQAGAGEQLIFNWPDANANYYSTQNLVQQHSFKIPEPLNTATDNLLHTRSLNVQRGYLVPMTWLPNLAIFALFFILLGSFGVLLLIPLLSATAVYLFYKILQLVFKSDSLAFWATALFWPLAPWYYFSQLAMLTNILFIFFVMLAGFFLARRSFWLSSLFLALGLMCRPTEVIWLGLAFACLFYWQGRKIQLKHIISSVLVFTAVVFACLYLNKITYGSFLSFGYINFQDNTLAAELIQRQPTIINWLKALFIPFGFNLKLIAYNFAKYFIKLTWPYVLLAILGLFAWWPRRREEKTWSYYLLLNIIIFVFILLFYGSWDLADPLVKNLNFISSSYVRYFLPLYILLLPWSAYALTRLAQKAHLKNLLVYPLLIFLALFSLWTAYYSENDGLIQHQKYLASYWQQFSRVKQIAPRGAVIISERSDKLFFPYYRTVVSQGDLPLWPRLAKIEGQVPIYYYTDQEISSDQKIAAQSGLVLSERADILDGFSLYKINLLNSPR